MTHLDGIALTQWPESLIVFAGTENPATLRPQSLGSAITYARRYAIQAALGIAAETR